MTYRCPRCLGMTQVLSEDRKDWITCPLCSGRGWISEEEQIAVDRIIDMVTGFASTFEATLTRRLKRMGELWESRKS